MMSPDLKRSRVDTQIFKIDARSFEPSDLNEPARILSEGGLVGFPTETVYGIAASSRQPEAVHRLRSLQGREQDDPFSLHIASPDDVVHLAESVPPLAQSLMDLYWPGPLTIIFPGNVPSSADKGVGIRLPSHAVALELIRQVGAPLVAPSANAPGHPPAVTGQEVLDAFAGQIDAVIDSGPVALRQASTVVRLLGDELEVLREGIISQDMIERALKGKRIVFVCTGNSCRSPMAESIFKQVLAERLGVSIAELPDRGYRISSAGVQAFSGGRASQHAVELMEARGLHLENHRTRPLTRTMAQEADLIIALSHNHRWQIVQWDPEFASKVEVINEAGVTDPIGGSLEVYRQCAAEIEAEVREQWLERIIQS